MTVRIGQGKEKSKEFLKEHPEIFEEIKNKIVENSGVLSENMLTGPDEDEDESFD